MRQKLSRCESTGTCVSVSSWFICLAPVLSSPHLAPVSRSCSSAALHADERFIHPSVRVGFADSSPVGGARVPRALLYLDTEKHSYLDTEKHSPQRRRRNDYDGTAADEGFGVETRARMVAAADLGHAPEPRRAHGKARTRLQREPRDAWRALLQRPGATPPPLWHLGAVSGVGSVALRVRSHRRRFLRAHAGAQCPGAAAQAWASASFVIYPQGAPPARKRPESKPRPWLGWATRLSLPLY